MSRESELAALAGKYPLWAAWRGMSGLFYARLRGTGDKPVSGEDVTDLGDQIERAQRLAAAGEMPSRHLDRIRREYPAWSVQHVTAGHGWTAHRGDRRIWAGMLSDLDRQLRDASQGTP